jgi:hypothetical protein
VDYMVLAGIMRKDLSIGPLPLYRRPGSSGWLGGRWGCLASSGGTPGRIADSLEVHVVEAVFLSGSIVHRGEARQDLQTLVERAAGVDHQVVCVIAAQYVVGFTVQGRSEEETVYVEVALGDAEVGAGQLFQLIAVSYMPSPR